MCQPETVLGLLRIQFIFFYYSQFKLKCLQVQSKCCSEIFVKMHISGLHPKPTKCASAGNSTRNTCFNGFPRGCFKMQTVSTSDLGSRDLPEPADVSPFCSGFVPHPPSCAFFPLRVSEIIISFKPYYDEFGFCCNQLTFGLL